MQLSPKLFPEQLSSEAMNERAGYSNSDIVRNGSTEVELIEVMVKFEKTNSAAWMPMWLWID